MRQRVANVISGSDSDWKEGKGVTDAVRGLHAGGVKIDEGSGVRSAHRSPELMMENARTLVSRGVHYVVAAAGGAAHLPGMTAAETTRPVIGLPIAGSTGSLAPHLSINEMPGGIPVATVGAGRGDHAAQFILQSIDALERRRKKVSIVTTDPTQARISITTQTLKDFEIEHDILVRDTLSECGMDFWRRLGAVLITDSMNFLNVQRLAAERPTIILPSVKEPNDDARVAEDVMSLLQKAPAVSVSMSSGGEARSNAALLSARILATVYSDIEAKLQALIHELESGVTKKDGQHDKVRTIIERLTGGAV